jgi:hypothetical protein
MALMIVNSFFGFNVTTGVDGAMDHSSCMKVTFGG